MSTSAVRHRVRRCTALARRLPGVQGGIQHTIARQEPRFLSAGWNSIYYQTNRSTFLNNSPASSRSIVTSEADSTNNGDSTKKNCTEAGGLLEGWKIGEDGVTQKIPMKDLPLSKKAKENELEQKETSTEVEGSSAADSRDVIVGAKKKRGEASLTQVKDGIKDISEVIGPSKVVFRPRPGFRSYKEERHNPLSVARQQAREYRMAKLIVLIGIVATFNYKFKEAIDCTGNMGKITSPNQIFAMRIFFGIHSTVSQE